MRKGRQGSLAEDPVGKFAAQRTSLMHKSVLTQKKKFTKSFSDFYFSRYTFPGKIASGVKLNSSSAKCKLCGLQ